MSVLDSLQRSIKNLFSKEPKKLTFIIGEDFYKKSRIPDMQDRNAFWDNNLIEDIADLKAFYKNKELYYSFYNEKREQFKAISPGSIHKELTSLQEEYDVSIITLAVDNLFERVGGKNIIHLNGSLFEMFCDNTVGGCGKVFKIKKEWDKHTECPRCSDTHTVRPNLVWLKLDTEFSAWQAACLAVENCDLLIQIGVDAHHHFVQPLLDKCYSNKVEINKTTCDPDETLFEFVLEGDIKKNVPLMKTKLKKYLKAKKPKAEDNPSGKKKKKK